MEFDHVVLVTVSDAVLTDGPTGGHVTGQAAVEVGHGVSVLLGDGEQALAKLFCYVESYPVAIFLVA